MLVEEAYNMAQNPPTKEYAGLSLTQGQYPLNDSNLKEIIRIERIINE